MIMIFYVVILFIIVGLVTSVRPDAETKKRWSNTQLVLFVLAAAVAGLAIGALILFGGRYL